MIGIPVKAEYSFPATTHHLPQHIKPPQKHPKPTKNLKPPLKVPPVVEVAVVEHELKVIEDLLVTQVLELVELVLDGRQVHRLSHYVKVVRHLLGVWVDSMRRVGVA